MHIPAHLRRLGADLSMTGLDPSTLFTGQALQAFFGFRPLNTKTGKVVRLIRLLKDSQAGLMIPEIARKLEVDARTVKRYLADLRRMQFDLLAEKIPGRVIRPYRIQESTTSKGFEAATTMVENVDESRVVEVGHGR